MRTKLLLSVAIVMVVLYSSPALALDPMGSPAAGLNKGQLSVGGQYIMSSMNMKLVNGQYLDFSPYAPEGVEITNVDMDKYYLNLGYGISDNWNAFLLLGGASDEADIKGTLGDPYIGSLDAGSAFAFGLGTKVTFFTDTDNNITWGGMAQISRASFNGSFILPDFPIYGDVDIRLIETQFAVGPTYQVVEGISVYGGPFFHFISGEWRAFDSEGSKSIYNLEEQSFFGGYVGAQVDVADNGVLNVEWIHTDEADGIGAGFIWSF